MDRVPSEGISVNAEEESKSGKDEGFYLVLIVVGTLTRVSTRGLSLSQRDSRSYTQRKLKAILLNLMNAVFCSSRRLVNRMA